MSATAFQRKRREEALKQDETEVSTEYDSLSLPQLKLICKKKGIEYKKNATKAELIEFLQGTD
jgi:hypothetical protein